MDPATPTRPTVAADVDAASSPRSAAVESVHSPVSAYVASSAAASGASPGNVLSDVMVKCCNCDEEKMFAECAPWGKSTYSCSDCKCNYNRKTEAIRGKPDEQKWFRSVLKDPTARVNWFKRNKFCNQPNKKKTFDEAGILEDSSGTRDWSSDIDRYKWLTPEEWIIRVRALGLAGNGTPQQQHQVGLDDYKAKCADKTFPKLCKHGMWLLGVFKGVEHQEGSEESKGRAWKRRKTVDDSQSFDVARTLHAESVADGQAWLRERAQLSSLNFRGSMAQQPGVLSFDVRSQAQPLARQDEEPKEIQQGVLHQMQRDMRATRGQV